MPLSRTTACRRSPGRRRARTIDQALAGLDRQRRGHDQSHDDYTRHDSGEQAEPLEPGLKCTELRQKSLPGRGFAAHSGPRIPVWPGRTGAFILRFHLARPSNSTSILFTHDLNPLLRQRFFPALTALELDLSRMQVEKMVVIEDIARDVSGEFRSRPSVVRRTVVCMIAGVIEAVAAATVVYLVALTYHLAVLHIHPAEFDHLAYILFATLAGALYGAFSAIACEHILAGERRLEWALSTSLYGWTAAVGITLLSAFLAGNIGELSRVTLTTAFLLGIFVLLLVRTAVRGEILRPRQQRRAAFRAHRRHRPARRRRQILMSADFWRRGHVLTGTLHIEEHTDANGVLCEQDVTEFARQNVRRGDPSCCWAISATCSRSSGWSRPSSASR